MRLSRSRTFALAGLLGALCWRALAQQPADPAANAPAPASSFEAPEARPVPSPPLVPSPAAPPIPPTTPGTGETLFPVPSANGPAAPDFSGSRTAPASAFTPQAPANGANVPDFSARGIMGGAAPSGAGAGPGGTGAGPGGAAAKPAAAGFLPGPFQSPASTTPTTPNGVAAPAAVFGTTGLGSNTGLGAGAGTGTAGLGGANTRTPNPSTPESFTLPGAYGQAPLTFSAGAGRLARPRAVWSATAQFGYDDNVLQTPTAQLGLPAQFALVQTQAEIPDRTVLVVIPPKGPQPVGIRPRPTIVTQTIKGQPAVFEKVLVSPAVVPQERIGSVVARSGLGFEFQMANRRTVFTADAHVNADYYFSRPNDQTDFNGNVSLIYAHRYSSRVQFSANVSAAYLSQPDVRVISGPTRQVGDYLTYNSKFDLSYQFNKRVSTVTSVTLGLLNYMNAIQQLNNTYSVGIGEELRYTKSAKLTWVGEVRAATTTYPNGPARDSKTYFLLVGADYAYSRRLSGIIRVGESVRSFDAGGGAASAPYLETTAAYRFSNRGSLSWNSRFGFEEPQDANSEVLVFRTTLSAVQAFTARLRGSASIGYINRVTSSTQSLNNTDITGSTYTFDLGLDYALTKKFSVNASYSFIDDVSSLEGSDYYRNQFFLGAQYTF
jgi:opacity protein-like surface antigen